jgi:RHS repeat-associated protein
MGEKVAVNAANGSASATIPLPLSPGRSSFGPKLALGYSSGAGNGPFGFGWSLDTPAITRKTDKGLPRYDDAGESDVFVLGGAEDLVPVLDATGKRQSLSRTVWGAAYLIHIYRPRIEGLYARIERWTEVASGLSHWRSISRDNVSTLYGYDAASRVSDPADPTHVFAWHISRSWDSRGNLMVHDYVREDGAGIDTATSHEANRSPAARAAQIYLKAIRWTGDASYLPDWTAAAEPALPANWAMQAVIDYGDHGASPPTPTPDQPWPVRPDPFSNRRPGFELRTYRRARRVMMFHSFPDEASAGRDLLTSSLDLTFSDEVAPVDPRNPVYTFIASATHTGYRLDGASFISRSLPPLEFDYSTPVIGSEVLPLDRDSLADLPEGIDGSRFRWLDLDGEGAPGILSFDEGGWWYKRNQSAANLAPGEDGALLARAKFAEAEPVARISSRNGLEGQQFLDLAGEGRQDLVAFAEPEAGFYRRTLDEDFEPLKRFAKLPAIDWSDPNLRFIDLTGDGLADVLITEDGVFTYYQSMGAAGFGSANLVRTPWDEEQGPKLVLSDGVGAIFIADMTGDGLNALVRVRNGEACYWPNLGYGRFGAKVTMDRAPRFAAEPSFEPRRIRLADIDGSGAVDIVYVDENGVRAWFNQSGNAWSAPSTIAVFPSADLLGSVQVIDLLGTGTACLVWSSPLPGPRTPLVYVDLMSGQKPHLLVAMRNNLGAETRISYAPSTRFYLEDQAAGEPWVTRLPFPVQVVERCEVIDWIGRNRLVSRYSYHHGYFDGFEREFRGFGRVDQRDTEELRSDTAFPDGEAVNFDAASFSPPVLTRSWFHTGAFRQALAVSRQYAKEYWVESNLSAAAAEAMALADTLLPDGLDGFEAQEGYRALKGHAIRVEVYAEDGSPAASNPYSVSETIFTLTCLQRRGPNRHAVFAVAPRESLTFQYERAGADPHVTHELTLEVDAYGNPLRTLAVGYPRRAGYAAPEPGLSASFQSMLAYDQTRLHIRAVQHLTTNAIDDVTQWPDAYRAPLSAGMGTAEITGATPTVKAIGVTDVFAFAEADALWQSLAGGASDIPYEQVPASDVDGAGAPAAAPTRRIVGQARVLYRSDDLSNLLPHGQVGLLAMVGESYSAAVTPGQVTGVLGGLVGDADLTAAGYVQLAGESAWWAPSGRIYLSPGDHDTAAQELAEAQVHFFLPRRAVDPFGGIARITYDAHDLLPLNVTDSAGNQTTALSDYRVLAPVLVTDANGNRAAVVHDALGMVAASAVMGPVATTLGDSIAGVEPDLDPATLSAFFADPVSNGPALLGTATTRLLYDLDAYQASGAPPVVATLARETHVSDVPVGQTSAVQYGLAYSDGFGRAVQSKARVADGPVTDGGANASPRWRGSGWTIFTKGRPMRRYEPFFTATSGFEFAAQYGVATTTLYDAPGRAVATLHPDQSWTKTVFDAWRQEVWDANDTVLTADPRTDADVGSWFVRLLGAGAFTSWYNARIGVADAIAAATTAKAAAHAATPAVTHFDALGRACLAIGDCGGGQRFPMRTAVDTEGKPLVVFDALGRRTQQYVLATGAGYLAGTDMAGRPLYEVNADAGVRQALDDCAGQPFLAWDARQHAFRIARDAARRQIWRSVSTAGGAPVLVDLTVWGEGQVAAANLAGRMFRHYDMAGFVENSAYDYADNLIQTRHQLGLAYDAAPDWAPLTALTQGPALDSAAETAGLVPTGDGGRDSFVASTVFDALNRPVQSVTPHSAGMKPNVIQPRYDSGGQLYAVDVWLQQAAAPTALLDPATADRHLVTALTYNERGQRASIAYGNGTAGAYAYDPLTFRLASLITTRPPSFASDQQIVQDLAYAYDPVGNVTHIQDDADTQDVIFFANQRVEPSADYTYDPLYRLSSASGREHLGQTGGTLNAPIQVNNDDSARIHLPQPGDGQAMGVYTENYSYDALGNILAMAHQVGANGWTRRYAYAEASRVDPAETGNRLSATSLPGDAVAGPYSAAYAYDEHGSMIVMPHLPAMAWDEDERLRSTTRQVVNSGTPATTWYAYGADGQRVRKVSRGQAGAGQSATRVSERLYLGGLEIWREFAGDGATVTLSRETLHLDAGTGAAALVETRTLGSDPAPAQQVRYQHANHLGSAVLELGDDAGIITYEEYFPFGATSYQAVSSQTDLPRRFRYTAKERDEENNFYYHGARYYAPWLGRWTACDPARLKDGPNLCAYVSNNPVRMTDPTGTDGKDPGGADFHVVEVPQDPSDPGPGVKAVFDPPSFQPLPSAKVTPDDPPAVSPPAVQYMGAGSTAPKTGNLAAQGGVIGRRSSASVGGTPGGQFATGLFKKGAFGGEVILGGDFAGGAAGDVGQLSGAIHVALSPKGSANTFSLWATGSAGGLHGFPNSALNAGGAGTFGYERKFGRNLNQPRGVLGFNVGGGSVYSTAIKARGLTTYLRHPGLGSAALSFNLNRDYYGDSGTSRWVFSGEAFASGSGGSRSFSPDGQGVGLGGGSLTLGGGLGVTRNWRLDSGKYILTLGGEAGGQEQLNWVGGNHDHLASWLAKGVFGFAWR